MLKLEAVGKSYGDNQILADIDLDIVQGDFIALIGPSGAGKSTLLRLLNLLELPSCGRILYKGCLIQGKNKQELLQIKRTMTMVMQRSVMLCGTVAQNVAVGLKLRGLEGAEIAHRVKESLNFVELAGFEQRKATTLSGGEVQRVALARAIALRPEILFLDEPTASLDPKNVSVIEGLISNVQSTLGTTVVMVTHNLFQAKRMAAKTVFMNEGRLVEVGTTKEIFAKPKMKLTADFVSGTMIY